MAEKIARAQSQFQGWIEVDPPIDLFQSILSLLPPHDLWTALFVNRRWHSAAAPDKMWTQFLAERTYRPRVLSVRLFVLRNLIKRALWGRQLDQVRLFSVIPRPGKLEVTCIAYCYPNICLAVRSKKKQNRLYLINERNHAIRSIEAFSEPIRFMRCCGAPLLAVVTPRKVQVWNLKHRYCRGEFVWFSHRRACHQLTAIDTTRNGGSTLLSCLSTSGEQRVYRLFPLAGGQVRLVASAPPLKAFSQPTPALSTDIQTLPGGRLLGVSLYRRAGSDPGDRRWVIRLWAPEEEAFRMTYQYVGRCVDVYEGLCASDWFVLRHDEGWQEFYAERLTLTLSYLAERKGDSCDMAYKLMTFDPASNETPGVGSAARFLSTGRLESGMKRASAIPFHWQGSGEALLLSDRSLSTLHLFVMTQGGFSSSWAKPYSLGDVATSSPLICERRGVNSDSACLGLFIFDPQEGHLNLVTWGRKLPPGPPITLGD